MPPRKRKQDDQKTLEDVTDQPVKVTKSKKGDLAHPKKEEVKPKHAVKNEDDEDLFLKRRAKKTGVQEAPPPKAKEAKSEHKEAAAGASDAGIWCDPAQGCMPLGPQYTDTLLELNAGMMHAG